MVIGNGLIASQFYDYKTKEEILIFASGVSNSSNTEQKEFQKEIDLLKKIQSENKEKKLVYFSTCSITDNATNKNQYVKHKKEIEEWIQNNVLSYTIFRLSNPVGKNNNPNTVFNFFVNHIQSGTPFLVWQYAYRNIIDVEDMYKICHYILTNHLFENKIVEIANPESYSVLTIIHEIETYFGYNAVYSPIEKGSDLHIDTSAINPIINDLSITFDQKYISSILKKYFPKK